MNGIKQKNKFIKRIGSCLHNNSLPVPFVMWKSMENFVIMGIENDFSSRIGMTCRKWGQK